MSNERKYRMVRTFPNPNNSVPGQTSNVCYRVETSYLMTEAEAMALMAELGSPYES